MDKNPDWMEGGKHFHHRNTGPIYQKLFCFRNDQSQLSVKDIIKKGVLKGDLLLSKNVSPGLSVEKMENYLSVAGKGVAEALNWCFKFKCRAFFNEACAAKIDSLYNEMMDNGREYANCFVPRKENRKQTG